MCFSAFSNSVHNSVWSMFLSSCRFVVFCYLFYTSTCTAALVRITFSIIKINGSIDQEYSWRLTVVFVVCAGRCEHRTIWSHDSSCPTSASARAWRCEHRTIWSHDNSCCPTSASARRTLRCLGCSRNRSQRSFIAQSTDTNSTTNQHRKDRWKCNRKKISSAYASFSSGSANCQSRRGESPL